MAQNRDQQNFCPSQTYSFVIVEKGNEAIRFTTKLIINRDDALSQRFVKKEEGAKLYGSKAKRAALVVRLKPNVELLTLPEIFEAYNVSSENQKLQIVVDDQYIDLPETILAVKSAIRYVKADTHWYTKKPVLYIRTVNQLPDRGPKK